MPSPPNLPWLNCLSAPTSPNRASELYQEFDEIPILNDQTDEFAFHVSKDDATKPTVSAAELFHGGKIRPLEPLANDPYRGGGGQVETTTFVRSPLLSSSTSPKSSHSKARKTFWSVFTPKRNKPTNPRALGSLLEEDDDDDGNHRGRERAPSSSTSASIRRGTRSLSPIRLPNYPPWEDDDGDEDDHHHQKKESNSSSTFLTLVQTPSKSSRMKKLKNFLLFRSASEGHASDKLEPSKKLAAFYRSGQSEANEMPSSSSKTIRRTAVSAHERHYAMKKAASDDLKKKTFLPYKPGILGR